MKEIETWAIMADWNEGQINEKLETTASIKFKTFARRYRLRRLCFTSAYSPSLSLKTEIR